MQGICVIIKAVGASWSYKVMKLFLIGVFFISILGGCGANPIPVNQQPKSMVAEALARYKSQTQKTATEEEQSDGPTGNEFEVGI